MITHSHGEPNQYRASILADSISPDGVRLTTLECRFPRFILAEVNTHRVFSRNSASSRAIPTEKIIEAVKKNPFVPETFNKRVRGMGIGESFEDRDQGVCRDAWLYARDKAVIAAQVLVEIGTDKSRVNRLLEPFMWHTAIISATEFANFFALRQPPGDGDVPDRHFPAQPEFQIIARLMRMAMEESEPFEMGHSGWHLPLVTEAEITNIASYEMLKRISASRCARVSFDKHTDTEDYAVTLERADRLIKSNHLSPCEHQATPTGTLKWCGNFRGWFQFRKEIPHESNHARAVAAQEATS